MTSVPPAARRRSAVGRFRRVAALLVGVLGGLVACTTTTAGHQVAPPFVAPFVGTLQTAPNTAAQESENGIRVAMLEFDWADYETSPGIFDADYEAMMKSRYAALTKAGMRVTLALGLHFTPAWVADLPNSRFVDQRGNVSTEIDFTFNSLVRTAVEKYLDHLERAFGLENFWAVRITAGGSSELLYPGGGGYWAFGRNPQGGPQYPATLAPNPAPGWRPGAPGLSQQQIGGWYDWYLDALADTAKWQMTALTARGFAGYFQILTPGVGVQPVALTRAVAADLPPGLAGRGAAWAELYARLPHDRHVTVYLTSVADGSGGDIGCTPRDDAIPLTSGVVAGWSSARWLSRIAHEYRMTMAGENPGYGSPAQLSAKYTDPGSSGMMATAFRLARSCGLQGLYWAHDAQLWDGTVDIHRLYGYTAPTAGLPPEVSAG